MRQLFTLIIVANLINTMVAQDNDPAIVIDSKGKITAVQADGKKIKVAAGSAFDEQTTLTIADNSSVLLMRNGLFVNYTTSTFKIKDAPLPEEATLNFDPLFADYVRGSLATSMYQTNQGNWGIKNLKKRGDAWAQTDPKSKGGWGTTDPKSKGGWGTTEPKSKGGWGVTEPKSKGGWGTTDPKSKGGWGTTDPKSKGGWGMTDPKSKGGWGTTDPKSKGGWGKEDVTIQVKSPGGLYNAKTAKLSWIKHNDVREYLFCIFDDDLNMVHSEISIMDFVNVDLSKLDRSKTYYWQVFAGMKKAISTGVTFTIASQEKTMEAKEISKDSDIYAKSSNEVKGMMDAAAFEVSGFYLDAYQAYDYLLATYPNNDLVKLNYAAFCMRMGQELKAKSLAEKI